MLVLSRKPHQQIVISGLNIRITVLHIRGNRVQLGIEAPSGVQILRVEMPQWNDDRGTIRATLAEDTHPIQPPLPKHPYQFASRRTTSKIPGQEQVCVD